MCHRFGHDNFNHFSVNEATDIRRRPRWRRLAITIAHRFANKKDTKWITFEENWMIMLITFKLIEILTVITVDFSSKFQCKIIFFYEKHVSVINSDWLRVLCWKAHTLECGYVISKRLFAVNVYSSRLQVNDCSNSWRMLSSYD